MIVAMVLFALFLAVASTDAFYFHLWKYRLHARAASAREHLFHTANAILLLPQVYLLFCVRPRGAALWGAALVTLVILAIELGDVMIEQESRRDLGGVGPLESAMHFLMGALRTGSVMILFAGTSLDDWFPSGGDAAGVALGRADQLSRFVGVAVLCPGVVIAALHVALIYTGRGEIERSRTRRAALS